MSLDFDQDKQDKQKLLQSKGKSDKQESKASLNESTEDLDRESDEENDEIQEENGMDIQEDYPDETIIPADLNDNDKNKIFIAAMQCFEIIGDDDEEQERKERTPSAGNIDMADNFSQRSMSRQSTMRKKSTMRMKNLTQFQRQRLEQQNALVKKMEDVLKHVPEGIEIWQVQNAEGYSLLHQAAQSDQPVIFRRLIKIAKVRVQNYEKSKQKNILRSWVNKKTNTDLFAAIHFASFNGNLEICQMLIDEGADINYINSYGLNCLHFAAQGDQPSSLYFFHKVLNIDINKQDSRGSTPLHWAIFRMSELAMVYLLAWLPVQSLSIKDQEGYTAMHLAIKLSEKLESSRPVRVLLYHGAPTNIPDNNGKLPIDFANKIENQSVKDQVVHILQQKTTLSQFLQLESPTVKVSKSWALTSFYFVFQMFIYLMSYLFTFPLWQTYTEIIIVLSTQFIATLFFIISIVKSPGYIKPHKKVDFIELLQLIDPIQLCPTCKVVKSPRSKHCNVCDQCVERMDHHCPWLNNCVGITNHIYFLLMINFYAVNIICMFTFTLRYYIEYMLWRFKDQYQRDFTQFKVVQPIIGQYFALNIYVVNITNLSIIALFVPYIYFIGFIWFRQMITLLTNKTTAERFGKKKAARIDDEDSENESTTTSLLAEKAIQSIGIRQEYKGSFTICKYLSDFCGASCSADCGSQSNILGYQDMIIDELYKNQKERHGYEEDWGLIVLNMNTDIQNDDSLSEKSESFVKRPKKARAHTLQKKYGQADQNLLLN